MKDFLTFFLTNHLGPNICFFVVSIMMVKNFIKEFPSKYKNYKETNNKSEIMVDFIGTMITVILILLFIGIDLIQPTGSIYKSAYLGLTIISVLILIYADISDSK